MSELRIKKFPDGCYAALCNGQIAIAMQDDECLGLVAAFVHDRPMRYMRPIAAEIAQHAKRSSSWTQNALEAFGLIEAKKEGEECPS